MFASSCTNFDEKKKWQTSYGYSSFCQIKYLSFIRLIYHVFLQALFEGFWIMSWQILWTGVPGTNASIKWTILIL